MRRLAYTAVCASLILAAACTDTQAPTEPTPPEPEKHLGTCRPVRFPIFNVVNQIRNVVFRTAPAKVRLEALARAGVVALLWDTCHPIAARQAAVNFVNWIDLKAPTSVPAAKVTTLKVTILNGVGIPVTVPTSGSPDDFGVAIFDPANPNNTLVKTSNSCGVTKVVPGSFTEITVLSMSRLADDFMLTDAGGRRQFAPAYEIRAFNSQNDPVLKNEKKAIVAFNLLSLEGGYPENIGIGHNPLEEEDPGFPFEILEAADLEAEGLDDELAKCEDPERVASLGSGPSGFAKAALRRASQFLLPRPLWAAAFDKLPPPPPLGGKARTLSPFKVVEVSTPDEPLQLNLETVEKLPGGTQRFTVQDGASGPYIWSVNGDDGGNSTFGFIVVATDDPNSADYTAPASVPSTPTFDVCARRQANPLNQACASVTIQPVPSSGADIVVFNDLNIFDNIAAEDPNNLALYANLVSYTGSGARAANTRVLVHRGHNVRCDQPEDIPFANTECSPAGWSTFENTMRAVGSGYTVDDVDDGSAPLTTIAADVKVIILALPMTAYSTAEVNALKAFAGEGGRIVFVGEYDSFYGTGIGVENAFLTSMGAVMTNTGGDVDCGYNVLPTASLRSHQIMTGLTQLTMGCASVVDPGPDDYPLFYDTSGELVLGAVAKVDLTPLPIVLLRAAEVAPTGTQSTPLSNDAAGRGIVSKVPAGAQR